MRIKILLVILAAATALVAQDFRATLTGVITDPTGASIPGASIKVTNLDTNEIKETKTNSDGHYTVPYLNPGTYNVEVTATGFQTMKREKIVLRVSDKLELPIQLSIGQMTESVQVTGDQEVLDTADASRGLVFDPVKTQEYPLNGRQTYMLMMLTPGVLFTQEIIGPGGFSGTRGWDVNSSYKINGARPGTNVFLLNGARISDNGGTWDLAPNVEAVQEFKVMVNTYDAQFGGFSGGAVNTTLKSGTNSYHGDVFDYFRNNYFDANYFSNNANGQPTPYHNQHQFGGIFGGPVRKDKDYFFLSFEGWREVLPAPVFERVPTLNERNDNFGADGYAIYDPMTSAPCNTVAGCSGHTYVRTPFANGIIPQSRISPVALKILAFYPKPTDLTQVQEGQNYNAPNVKDQYAYNQPMVRVDHNFGDRSKLYAMATFQHGTENRDQTGFGPPAQYGNINNARTDQNYILSFTHILSPSTVFDVRLSYGRFTQSDPSVGDPNFLASNLGFPANMCVPTVPKCSAPRITFNSNALQGLFSGGSIISWYSFNTYDLVPTFTLSRGRHSIHLGGELVYQVRPEEHSGNATGVFNFDTGWTQHYSDQHLNVFDGNPVASLLLGNPQGGSIDYFSGSGGLDYISRPYFAGYVQDDWKVNPRLTLNLGMRYEVQIPWLERYNRAIRGFDFNTVSPWSNAVIANWTALAATYNANPANAAYPMPAAPNALYGGLLYAGQNGVPRRVYYTDWTNLAPRLGVAFRLTNKTVLRAGVGVFYRQQQNNLSTQYGFSATTSYLASVNGAGQFPSSGDDLAGPYSLAGNPFPQGIIAPYGNSLGLASNAGNGISINNPNYRTPRTYQYSFGIQRELPMRINFEASYAGNREIFVPVGYNMSNTPADVNQLNQFYNLQYGGPNINLQNRAYPNPFQGILPAIFGNTGTTSTISYGNLTRPWPLWQGLTQNYIQVGHYRSDQLAIRAEKRLGSETSGVFTWVLSYTFGKQIQADHRLNNWNLAEAPIWEIDDGTKVHFLAISGVWDLPFGKGRHFLNSTSRAVDLLASNWRVTPIWTWQTGFPLAMGSLRNFYNYCGTYVAANQNASSWINNNASCYAPLPNFILNLNPDRFSYIFQPQGQQLNAAVEKTIPYRERYKLVLRLEAFNLSNTPIRQNPNTSPTAGSAFGVLPNATKNQPRVLQIAGKFIF